MTLNTVLQIVLVCLPLVVPPLLAWCGAWYQSMVQKLPAAQQVQLKLAAATVVPAVEQLASAQLNGPGKKQMALQQAALLLGHLGIKNVNPDVLSSFIEEAVYSLKNVTPAPGPVLEPAAANG